MLNKILIVGFTNYDLMKVMNLNKKNKLKIIIYFNKKFYLTNKKNINLDAFQKILKKQRVISNYETHTALEKKNIIPFEYNAQTIENIIKKRLYIQRKITPYY